MSSATSRSAIRTRTDCRLCGSQDLTAAMRLASTPPANAFVPENEKNRPQESFPLVVHFCRGCGHVQLLDIVDPEILFRNYVYVSGTSAVFVEHFRRYAQSLLELTRLAPGNTVVEIGSNDGTLLGFFKAAGMTVLGIDPARAIAEQATERGIPTRAEFFTPQLADQLIREGIRDVPLVVANNVFAHADDLHGIAQGIAQLLGPDGVFAFEVSYLLDVCEKTLFDTIYHEHLSYHSVQPLLGFFEKHGLRVFDAERVDPHGGSIRVMVCRRESQRFERSDRLSAVIADEQAANLDSPVALERLYARIEERKRQLTALVRGLRAQGKRLAGFGAPAKATTLMFQFGMGPDMIEYLIDDSPLKQGLYSPGHHLPVVPSTWLYDPAHKPDAAVVLAWNFADSIIAKHRSFVDAGGRFIIPLPEVREVTS